MNERIKELTEQANAWYPDGYPSAEGGDDAWQNLVIFEKEDLQKFTELIVKEIVSKMAVEGCDFYYNEPNNYGALTVKFFVDGDANQMAGEEIKAQYHDGIRGTGRYKLNDKFVKHLMKKHFGVE